MEVHEIYDLDLTAATDLVVLSACETVIGELSAGDEVVGLNRALLYAGTPSVMASLWNVDDKAAGLLMERLYTHLRAGLGKAQALRQAQQEVRAKDQHAHPYYWAAFVLTGDGKEIISEGIETETDKGETGPSSGGGWPCSGAALSVGLILLTVIYRQRAAQKTDFEQNNGPS